MKKSAGYLFFLIVIISAGCAKRGTPEGGPIDEIPPQYVRARPENFTTNFDAREIRIYFDEYIKMQDPQRQIIISPPMDPKPDITPLGTASKSITININDTLQPNTTYTINFGRSITDNNEGNPLDYFTYAFSTGPYIDSLTVAGNVSDALLKMPDPYISVMLYEVDSTYSDSVIYNRIPRYVTNTLDSLTTFELRNLKEGTYQLVGMRDVNNNYIFDPATDKVAFADEYITIPTESVFDLILFSEDPNFRFMRPQQKSAQHLLFGYEGLAQPDSLTIEMISPKPEGFESRITKDREKDTLHYWYKPTIERDSLRFIAEMPGYRDTLLTRRKEMKMDSLQFTFEPKSTINFAQNLQILPNIPLSSTNDSLINIVDKDTLPVAFTTKYDNWKNELVISFEKKESQVYRLTALPGAFTDFFGKENDTLKTQIRTQAYADYGNLVINLQNVQEFPVILQLTTEKGEVQAEKYSTGSTSINFQNIKPGKYLLRLIYDSNENRIWDSGSFLQRRQPEKVVYFPDPLEVRANWDVTQTFNVE
ncbi:Ig-like domain-containing protein [Salinimicrobium catena]|uniref:Ig-like domain-containing protein n=1 Tax=Salinimicrobium catena TaxID=390640 RepID=A0A1H5JA88_9FLAO|nr:Ig-like domain-containing protein [Salinimicrobium catena]SDK85802.1 Ig-like domain-containing protein [Salinimicrobium catena]SEE49320.1 Ig-like domain-containing protein [Salinimicrobium catena]